MNIFLYFKYATRPRFYIVAKGTAGKLLISLLLLWSCCSYGEAQKTGMQSFSMTHGESAVYDLYFKWLGIMAHAGEAVFSYHPDNSIEGASSRYQMLYKSNKTFDLFFKMRDTMYTHYNDNNDLRFSVKYSDEGGYYTIDTIKFKKEDSFTSIHSLHYRPSGIRTDTIMTVTENVTDMLGVIFYMRGIDRNTLKNGDVIPITVVLGKDLTKTRFIYQDKAIITDRNKVKYNTLYFKIDIVDEAFESTKTSAEAWVGDDDNMMPIKVRSKLKLGYVEVYYKSSTSLAHPSSCRIQPKK